MDVIRRRRANKVEREGNFQDKEGRPANLLPAQVNQGILFLCPNQAPLFHRTRGQLHLLLLHRLNRQLHLPLRQEISSGLCYAPRFEVAPRLFYAFASRQSHPWPSARPLFYSLRLLLGYLRSGEVPCRAARIDSLKFTLLVFRCLIENHTSC